MDFTLFRKHFNRTSILTTIFFISAIIIGVAIVGAKYTSDNSKVSVERIILFILDGLVLALFLWLLHMFGAFVSAAYVVTKKSYFIDNTKTTITRFTNPWWLHLVTVLFLVAIYFLSITGMMHPYDNNWIATAKGNWWIVLIVFFVNLIIIEFAYNLNLYKLNHDPQITNEL